MSFSSDLRLFSSERATKIHYGSVKRNISDLPIHLATKKAKWWGNTLYIRKIENKVEIALDE